VAKTPPKGYGKPQDDGPLILDRTTLWEVLALATDSKEGRETAFQAALDRTENKGLAAAAHAFCHQDCLARATHLQAGKDGLPGACSTCSLARYSLTQAEFAVLDQEAEAGEAPPLPGRLPRGSVKPIDDPGTPPRIAASEVVPLEL